MNSEVKSCANCRFAVMIDSGTSNYSVEGTNFYCGKKAHPLDGFDSFYETAPGFAFAESCEIFEKGSPLAIDVDMNVATGLTEEELELYNRAMG